MGILLITHDLGVVAEVASHVVVMYAGRVVERATAARIFEKPRHPYTRGLLRSLPKFEKPAIAEGGKRPRLPTIEGLVPNPFSLPPGCRFADRCPFVVEECTKAEPELVAAPDDDSHEARCIRAEEVVRSP